MDLVEGDVVPDQAPQAVDECGEGDCSGRVAVPRHLRTSARKVKQSVALATRQRGEHD